MPTRPRSDPVEPGVSPKGGPQLILLLIGVVAPTFLVGQLLGAGGAAIVGGFIALFSLISSMGGSLRANLRRFFVVGPLVAFGTVVPRMLAEVSQTAAIATATIMVFVAGLMPLRGRRYEGTALGLGMGTLLGYSMPIGVVSGRQLAAAAVAGLLVALALLALAGAKDPSGPTREAVAALFDQEDRDFGAAFEAWTSDRAARWLGAALVGAGRYHAARRVLAHTPDLDGRLAAVLADGDDVAGTIAADIRAKQAPDSPPGPPATARPSTGGAQEEAPAVTHLFAALRETGRAVAERDERPSPIRTGARARVALGSVRAAFGYRSLQLRHAIRSSVAVLMALLVSLFLQPGDPLLPTLLLTTFGIVQASWRSTLSRARERFAGIVVGGVLVALILLLLPPSLLFPVSMLGLAVGMWFITAKPAVGAAAMIVMSVGLNHQLHDLEPDALVIEYLVLTLIALLIGSVIGFLVVPSWRPPALPTRITGAVESTGELLDGLGAQRGAEAPALNLRLAAAAQVATQQLVPDHEDLTGDQAHELERLRRDLQDLMVAAIFLTMNAPETGSQTLREAAATLRADDQTEDGQTDVMSTDDVVTIIAREVSAQRRRVEGTLRDEPPGRVPHRTIDDQASPHAG